MIILLALIVFIVLFISIKKNKEEFTSDNITVVSGFWEVKNKYGNGQYDEWFKNTLNINQRYIFFCDKKDIDYIKQYRKDKETIFVDYPFSNFYTKQYSTDKWVVELHVPSKEVAMIWNEKIHLLKLAKDHDRNPTEFYVWVDAGVAPYRHVKPPEIRLNLKDINSLPHDKLCYSPAEDRDFFGNFAATVLIIHKNIIDDFHDKYYTILKQCSVEMDWNCGSEQYVLSKMMLVYPELFYKMSVGYGQNLIDLYNI